MRVPYGLTVCAALVATALSPLAAEANGRFPSSNYFVAGPGPESRVLALRATFGVITSYDGGRSWSWVCEEALNAVGTFDASMSIGFDGTLVVGSPSGITVSRSECSWTSPRGNPMRPIVDVSNDATGRYLVTAIGPNGVDDTLMLSDDGGASWTAGARIPGFFTETVEIAPSDPSRIYVAGFIRGGIPVLLRSDDGGMTTSEVSRDTAFGGGTSAFVSGVDPTNPDVLYVRSGDGFGTILLRSDNGGRTFREIARTADQMAGFALSDDGGTVWIASADRTEGIRRSVRGGPFTRIAPTVTARCLRQHAGVLYVCTDEVADGYLLGSSIDGGDHIDPLMSGRLLAGPSPACNATTQVGMVCGPLWPMQRVPLASIDAGAPPVLVPRDAAVIDLGARTDTSADAVTDTPSDTSADAGSDIARDIVSDAASDAGGDIAGDTGGDAPSDIAGDTGSDAASDIASDAASDAVSDIAGDTGSDAASDIARDAARDVATDAGPATPPGDCGCRAQRSERGGAWALAMIALGLLGRRRKRCSHHRGR
ncbi:MAG: hypothetical protein U0326_02425 [Polyangiales bacterium]